MAAITPTECLCSINHVTGERTRGQYCPLHKPAIKRERVNLRELWLQAGEFADRSCGYGDENLWQRTAHDEYRRLLDETD